MEVQAAHSELLAAIHAEAFAEPWPPAAFAELLTRPGSFALLAAGARAARPETAPLGFILCRAAGGECEILTFAVLPAIRRQGVAKALLEAALAKAAKLGAEAVFLEVAADNAAARALYERAGFAAAGRRAAYYHRENGRSADALVMRRGPNVQASEK